MNLVLCEGYFRAMRQSTQVLIVVCFAGSGLSLAAPRDDLIAAWRQRQADAQMLDVAWRVNRSVSPQLTAEPGSFNPAGRSAAARAPLELQNEEGEFRYQCDPRRFRLTYDLRKLGSRPDRVTSHQGVEVLADDVRKQLLSSGSAKFPTYEESTSGTLVDARALAVLLVYRPWEGNGALIVESSLTDTGQRVKVGAYECQVFRHARGEVWVDPARDYLPVRYLTFNERRTKTRDVILQFARGERSGWELASWNAVRLSGQTGQVLESVAATVQRLDTNVALPETTFEIEIPSGTWVNNRRTHETYIVRSDGSHRPVALGEFDGQNYEQLLKSDPPSSKSRAMLWTLGAVALGLVTLFVLWLGSRSKRGAPANRRAATS